MAKGKVVQVIGTVVDILFPPDELPAINNGIEIPMNGQKIVTEVQAHLGNNWVRTIALTSTDGLARGAEAPAGKDEIYRIGQKFLDEFKNRHGSLHCLYPSRPFIK